MGLAQYTLGLGAGRERIALREESVEGDSRRVVGEKRIVAGEGLDRRFDLTARFLRADAGIECDAAIDPAPGGHRRSAVAALYSADIEVYLMRIVREMLAPD